MLLCISLRFMLSPRGFQGIGGAATIPSAVSILTFHCSESDVLFILLARYNGTCIPSFQSAFIGVRYFCCGRPCRLCIWHDRWRCPYPTSSVRHTCSRQQRYLSDVFMQEDVACRCLSKNVIKRDSDPPTPSAN